MILDGEGRLFGKINIIDFLALVLLVAAAGFIVTRFIVPKTGESEATLQFASGAAEIWILERIEEGEPVSVKETGRTLGAVSGVATGKAEEWVLAENGRYVKTSRPGFSALSVSVKALGEVEAGGVYIGGERYFVGDTLSLCIGDATLPMRLRDIRATEN